MLFSIHNVTIGLTACLPLVFVLMPDRKTTRAMGPPIPPETSPDDIERGRRFAAWLSGALAAKNWLPKRLADESGVLPTSISIYLNDGLDPQTGKIRRVKPATVRKLAAAVEMDVAVAMKAAGYDAELDAERVVIAPGRSVRVMSLDEDDDDFVDIVLTRDAIDLILAHDAVIKARSERGAKRHVGGNTARGFGANENK